MPFACVSQLQITLCFSQCAKSGRTFSNIFKQLIPQMLIVPQVCKALHLSACQELRLSWNILYFPWTAFYSIHHSFVYKSTFSLFCNGPKYNLYFYFIRLLCMTFIPCLPHNTINTHTHDVYISFSVFYLKLTQLGIHEHYLPLPDQFFLHSLFYKELRFKVPCPCVLLSLRILFLRTDSFSRHCRSPFSMNFAAVSLPGKLVQHVLRGWRHFVI